MSRPIEWYRNSPIKGVIVVATSSFFLLMVGVFILAGGMDNSGRVPIDWQPWLLMSGMCLVIFGVSVACYGFFRVFSNEGIYLELQTKGLMLKSKEQANFYHWQSIEHVEFISNAMIVTIENGSPIRIEQSFLGISGPELADRILDFQRKALLGTIR